MSSIESVVTESRVFPPADAVVQKATISGMAAYEALCKEAEKDYAGYWARLAKEHVTWKQPFTQSLDESNAPFYKWFADGKLNVSYNCLDRNIEAGLGDKVAIIFEADGGQVTKVTYKELLGRFRPLRQCAARRRASRRATAS
jgi:acetyl-CoA synthetase